MTTCGGGSGAATPSKTLPGHKLVKMATTRELLRELHRRAEHEPEYQSEARLLMRQTVIFMERLADEMLDRMGDDVG